MFTHFKLQTIMRTFYLKEKAQEDKMDKSKVALIIFGVTFVIINLMNAIAIIF